MSTLTETEIFDCLITNARGAADDCYRLGRGERGSVYTRLRERLRLCEGACRQMCHWREDTRWLQTGMYCIDCQQRIRVWLTDKSGPEKFRKMGDALTALEKSCQKLATAATGKVGAILPKPGIAPLRETRPSQIILPPGFVRKAANA